MKCPNCGADTRVIDTRSFYSTVKRVRQCNKCGYKFETWEEILPTPRDRHPKPKRATLTSVVGKNYQG